MISLVWPSPLPVTISFCHWKGLGHVGLHVICGGELAMVLDVHVRLMGPPTVAPGCVYVS